MSELAFRAKNLLESGAVTPGTFRENGGVIDLGRAGGLTDKSDQAIEQAAETVKVSRGLTRAQRERLPEKMAAQLMDYYMTPEALNNNDDFNPIRDGLPQCKAHPFDRANGKYGCTWSCGAKNPDTVLPTYMEHTVYDVFMWTAELVGRAVKTTELQKGWRRPTDLTR